jgi:hypothetical protein
MKRSIPLRQIEPNTLGSLQRKGEETWFISDDGTIAAPNFAPDLAVKLSDATRLPSLDSPATRPLSPGTACFVHGGGDDPFIRVVASDRTPDGDISFEDFELPDGLRVEVIEDDLWLWQGSAGLYLDCSPKTLGRSREGAPATEREAIGWLQRVTVSSGPRPSVTFQARIWRSERYWLVEAPAIGAMTQGLSFRDAAAMLVDWIRSMLDRPDFEVELTALGDGYYSVMARDGEALMSLVRSRGAGRPPPNQ